MWRSSDTTTQDVLASTLLIAPEVGSIGRRHHPRRRTIPQQDGDLVALGRGKRWCLRDDLGDVIGEFLGGVIASQLAGVFDALGITRVEVLLTFGAGHVSATCGEGLFFGQGEPLEGVPAARSGRTGLTQPE